MESVVKAVGQPVSFSDATPQDDENDSSINTSDADIQSKLLNESGRKRRHSSPEKYYCIFFAHILLAELRLTFLFKNCQLPGRFTILGRRG